MERAREDADGSELLEAPESGASLEQEREAAQGTEVFEDPDAILQRLCSRKALLATRA